MRRLVVRPRARAEFESALEWYASHAPDAAEEFAAQFEVALRLIEEAPERNRVVSGRLRRLLVRRFPYGVYYKVFPHVISVVGVIHGRRDPRRWLKRDGP